MRRLLFILFLMCLTIIPASALVITPIPIPTTDYNTFNNASGMGNTTNFSIDGMQDALFGRVDAWIGKPMRNFLIFAAVGAALAIGTGSLYPAGIILAAMGGLFLYQMPPDWRLASVMMLVIGGALIVLQIKR
jgi:hypothetical protein